MVATDGHRLSVVDRQVEGAKDLLLNQGVIIPRKGLFEIRKVLESLHDETIEIAIEGPQLVFKHGTTVLMIRLIEGRYPNYQQFIPQKLKNFAHASREELISSLKRVSLLSNQKSKGVTLTLSKGAMKITSNHPELGDAKEELEVQYGGDEFKIGFNAKYILDILNSFDDDNVKIELNDQLSPGVIRPQNDSAYTCVVMPMRI
jgi:DNA polymerase-3 subunit beta